MALDIFLIVVGILAILIGFVGCIVPMLPGPPIAYVGMLLVHFTDRVQFSWVELVVALVVMLATLVLDFIAPAIGTKKFGGSNYSKWGCVIGTFIGLFFGFLGIILGPFIGAVVGELIGGRSMGAALRSGWGSFLGFLAGTLAKIISCGIILFFVLKALIGLI